jgi:hypothetical protein
MNNEEKIVQLLNETVRWLRFQGLEKAKAAVAEHLDTDKKKLVFDLTDGKGTQASISKEAGVSTASLYYWWNEWYAAGIVTKEGDKFCHLFKLSEIGLSIGLEKTKNVKSAKPPK